MRIAAIIVLMAFLSGCIASNTVEQDSMATANRHAIIETQKGNIEIELAEDKAPLTTKNFVDLAKKGFYDGVKFHRVIRGFMIQTGDPTGTGYGGPGYTIQDEFSSLVHDKCVVSMANTGQPNTGGSQFFITEDAAHWLDGKHAVFGKVVKGCDIVPNIEQGDVMEKVTIV